MKQKRRLRIRSASLLARTFHTLELATYSVILGPILFTLYDIASRGFSGKSLYFSTMKQTLIDYYISGYPYFIIFGLACGFFAAFLAYRSTVLPITVLALLFVGYQAWVFVTFGFFDLDVMAKLVPGETIIGAIISTMVWWSLMTKMDVL